MPLEVERAQGRRETRFFSFHAGRLPPDPHGEPRILVTVSDATRGVEERRRLGESEERLARVLEGSSDGFWEWYPPEHRVFYSARMNEILGNPPSAAELDDRDWITRTHPDDAPTLRAEAARLLAPHGPDTFEWEFRTGGSSGRWHWVRCRGRVTARDAAGRPARISGMLGDVDAHREAEDALARSESMHRALMRNFPNGLVGLFDRSLRFLIVDGASTSSGAEPRSLVGKALAEVTSPEVRPVLEEAFRAALEGRSSRVEVRQHGRDLQVMTHPVRDELGKVILGVIMTQDVTETRALRSQLEVASRLAALGTLVSGIAHEINNPLAGSMAAQTLIVEDLRELAGALRLGEPLDRERVAHRLEEALESLAVSQAGSQRISRIVKDLTVFGRPDPSRTRVRLVDVVEEAMRWLGPSVGRSAILHVDHQLAPDVVASPGQLAHVVVNLVSNAAQAIPEGRRGEITVRIGATAGGRARLEVTDDGTGIEPEVMDRIFDPFFTTRRLGKGTGLGLSISLAVVTAHGGTIAASTTPGRGSSFVVELPPAPDAG
jgi:PAS domain S-box-containing protein